MAQFGEWRWEPVQVKPFGSSLPSGNAVLGAHSWQPQDIRQWHLDNVKLKSTKKLQKQGLLSHAPLSIKAGCKSPGQCPPIARGLRDHLITRVITLLENPELKRRVYKTYRVTPLLPKVKLCLDSSLMNALILMRFLSIEHFLCPANFSHVHCFFVWKMWKGPHSIISLSLIFWSEHYIVLLLCAHIKLVSFSC